MSVEKTFGRRFLTRVVIFYGTEETVLKDYSVNISTGGVFIESGSILPVGTELIVKFVLPDSNTLIATKARVAWINEPPLLKKSSLPPGMGVQFMDISSDVMKIILEYLYRGKFEPTW